MYEDQVFFSKLYLVLPNCVSDCHWAPYRQHDGNSGNCFSQPTYFRNRVELMEFIFQYSRRYWSALDERTRALIRRDRWRARHPILAVWALRLRARMRKLRRC